MVRIKKQYRQPDGTIIEVEGSEAEIEAFEKKQRKQKQQIESEEKKKTILYGKDLDEIRKIIREELAALPPKIEYRYHYYPRYDNPYWVNPTPYYYRPFWSTGDTYGGSITCDAKVGTVSNTNASEWLQKLSVGDIKLTATSPKSETRVDASKFNWSNVSDLIDVGMSTIGGNSIVDANSNKIGGWSTHNCNTTYKMSGA